MLSVVRGSTKEYRLMSQSELRCELQWVRDEIGRTQATLINLKGKEMTLKAMIDVKTERCQACLGNGKVRTRSVFMTGCGDWHDCIACDGTGRWKDLS